MNFLSSTDLPKAVERWGRDLGLNDQPLPGLTAPALLVLDMQNEFLLPEGLLPVWGGPAIIPNVARLIAFFRNVTLPVVFTRHVCLEPFKHRQQLGIMHSISDPSTLLREGTAGVSIHKDIAPRPEDFVITKYRYSAFYDTPLDTVLRVNEVKEVIITGVATNICCETTAHDAFFRGYEVVMTLDATGGTDENAHLASLKNIILSYGQVRTLPQVLKALEDRQQR